ncbi:Conjugal transfer protein TraG [Roseimaritima multifibrata]|uniref:Conjugal transfer protein TraG n=1 Tax=Roseimaritima multifibrata TaxID=1930274 RepID=A0A517MCK6_9BACT|nr:type IV secretory system conjugative DNA transfer family protein [Roseimaritima multifibrata]QDS92507.1 Conjugal transfer protein TraG [Roseimaritima multifibrata]
MPKLHSLLADLPRGRRPGDIGARPDAHFEAPENLVATRSLRFDPAVNDCNKWFIGVVGGKAQQDGFTREGRPSRYVTGGVPLACAIDNHIFLLASSRSGKGRGVLGTNLALSPPGASSFVIDPKGDLASQFIRYHALAQEKVCGLIDPMLCADSRTREYRVGICPIRFVMGSGIEGLVERATIIADSFVPEDVNARERHWDEKAKMALGPIAAHLATHPLYEGIRNGVELWRAITQIAKPSLVDESRFSLDVEMMSSELEYVRDGARMLFDCSETEFSGIVSTLRRHLGFLSIQAIQNCMLLPVQHDPSVLASGGVSLFSSLPAKYQSTCAGWQRFIIQAHLAQFEEHRIRSRYQCTFYLDEFHTLGRMKVVEQGAALLAGLGVRLAVCAHSLGQIRNLYSENFEIFLSNAGVIQAFAVADQMSLEYLSKRLGNTSTLSHASSAATYGQQTGDGMGGDSYQVGSDPLMAPHEIEQYFGRDDSQLRQLILRPSHKPAITQRAYLDKHSIFANRFDEVHT